MKATLESTTKILKAAVEITGELDSIASGHTGDTIYGYRELDEMLKLLKIEVVG